MQLLVPDLLVPRHVAHEVLADLKLPALQALMAQARPLAREPEAAVAAAGGDAQFSRPASRWLARRFGIEGATAVADVPAAGRNAKSPALPNPLPEAALRMTALGIDPGDRQWWCVEPCAFTAATDHVVLATLRPGLTADESAALAAAIAPSLDPIGAELLRPTPDDWFLHWPALDGLRAAEPLRALGRNIDIWGARGPSGEYDPVARQWRRLQNEIQMSWFGHAVLAAREARGAAAVNGLWLHGGGSLAGIGALLGDRAGHSAAATRSKAAGYGSAPGAVAARADQLGLRALMQLHGAANIARNADADALVLLDELEVPAAREDWAGWRDAIEALERDWFAPLLASGRRFELIACSEQDWREFGAGAVAGWKFWRRKTLIDTLAVDLIGAADAD